MIKHAIFSDFFNGFSNSALEWYSTLKELSVDICYGGKEIKYWGGAFNWAMEYRYDFFCNT